MLLAEGPGVSREKKCFFKKIEKINRFFIAFNTPRPPMSVHKKIQSNWSCRLAVYTQYIYEYLVLLFKLKMFAGIIKIG